MKIELASTTTTGTRPVARDARGHGASGVAEHVDDHRCLEVDLFPTARSRVGSRFDDTVALPVDAPLRLDAVLHAASCRLRDLPRLPDLSHRTLAYRARLQQILREAAAARRRLDDGTYGRCLACSGPISLALLTERPWRLRCVYCDLDI